MKRNYMKPEMVIVQIKAQQALLVGSVNETLNDANNQEDGYFD